VEGNGDVGPEGFEGKGNRFRDLIGTLWWRAEETNRAFGSPLLRSPVEASIWSAVPRARYGLRLDPSKNQKWRFHWEMGGRDVLVSRDYLFIMLLIDAAQT
jgi:hypothetical protein